MDITKYNSEEKEALKSALYVFNTVENSQHINTTNSISDYESSARPFLEAIVQDLSHKINFILGKELTDSAKRGLAEVNIKGLNFSEITIKKTGENQFIIKSLVSDDNNEPICQLHFDYEDKDRVTVRLKNTPPDNPNYEYSDNHCSCEIMNRDNHLSFISHVWLPNANKIIDVSEKIKPYLQPYLNDIDYGNPNYLNTGLSRYEINMSQYKDIIALDGGFPGALCRVAANYMEEGAYANCFKQAAPDAIQFIDGLARDNVFYNNSYVNYHDDIYATLVRSEKDNEIGLVLYSDEAVAIFVIDRNDKNKPEKMTSYQSDVDNSLKMIDSWILGERNLNVPVASYDFVNDQIILPNEFVQEKGGNLLGLSLHYIKNSFQNLKKTKGKTEDDSISIDKDFDTFLEMLEPFEDYDEDEVESPKL